MAGGAPGFPECKNGDSSSGSILSRQGPTGFKKAETTTSSFTYQFPPTAHVKSFTTLGESYPVDLLQTGGGQGGQGFVVQLQGCGANVLGRMKKTEVRRGGLGVGQGNTCRNVIGTYLLKA